MLGVPLTQTQSFTTELTYLDTNPNKFKACGFWSCLSNKLFYILKWSVTDWEWPIQVFVSRPSAPFVVWHGEGKSKCQETSQPAQEASASLPLKAFPTFCLLGKIENRAQIVLGDCSGCYGKRIQVRGLLKGDISRKKNTQGRKQNKETKMSFSLHLTFSLLLIRRCKHTCKMSHKKELVP